MQMPVAVKYFHGEIIFLFYTSDVDRLHLLTTGLEIINKAAILPQSAESPGLGF